MSRVTSTLEPMAAIPCASIDCQLRVKSSRCSSVVARQAARSSLHARAQAQVLGVQGHGPAHPVEGQRSGHGPSAAAAVDEPLAVELHRGVADRVQEVPRPQVVVAQPHPGVDARRVDDHVHGGVLHALGYPYRPGERGEPAADAGQADVAGREADGRVRRVELPVAGLRQQRRLHRVEDDLRGAGLPRVPHDRDPVERRVPLRGHGEPVLPSGTATAKPPYGSVSPLTMRRPIGSVTSNAACRTGRWTVSRTRQLSRRAVGGSVSVADVGGLELPADSIPRLRPNMADAPPCCVDLTVLAKTHSIMLSGCGQTEWSRPVWPRRFRRRLAGNDRSRTPLPVTAIEPSRSVRSTVAPSSRSRSSVRGAGCP